MTKGQLTQLKQKLEERKEFLEQEIKRLRHMPDFGDDIDSGEEEADETAEYGNQLALAQTYKEEMADIEAALEKLNDDGDYGVCEVCKRNISYEILEMDPTSKLCQECKRNSKK